MCAPSLRTIAEPPALNEIDRTMEDLWQVHPHVPQSIRFRVGIAVNESSANIIKHATRGIGRPVELQMWAKVRDNDVIVLFSDDGIPAIDDLITREMPHELDESGRGVALSRAALSILEYRRSGDRNHWVLVSDRF